MPIGNRILVVGCSGGGKSTFSRKLRDCTGLPLIHLDNIWWKADRTHITRPEFDQRLDELLKGKKWIMDGDYSRTYEVRIRACDTVIFLDYSEEVCLKGVMERIGKERADIPWVEHEPDPELIALVRNFGRDSRPALCALFEKYPEKQVIIFKTRSQADEWLKNMEYCSET